MLDGDKELPESTAGTVSEIVTRSNESTDAKGAANVNAMGDTEAEVKDSGNGNGSSHGGGSKGRNLTHEEMQRYFHLPIIDAAKQLGVCVTVLKKQCRRHGITRWPHRKLKSLDKRKARLEKEEASAADKAYYKHELRVLNQKKDRIFRHTSAAAKEANRMSNGEAEKQEVLAKSGNGDPASSGDGQSVRGGMPGVCMNIGGAPMAMMSPQGTPYFKQRAVDVGSSAAEASPASRHHTHMVPSAPLTPSLKSFPPGTPMMPVHFCPNYGAGGEYHCKCHLSPTSTGVSQGQRPVGVAPSPPMFYPQVIPTNAAVPTKSNVTGGQLQPPPGVSPSFLMPPPPHAVSYFPGPSGPMFGPPPYPLQASPHILPHNMVQVNFVDPAGNTHPHHIQSPSGGEHENASDRDSNGVVTNGSVSGYARAATASQPLPMTYTYDVAGPISVPPPGTVAPGAPQFWPSATENSNNLVTMYNQTTHHHHHHSTSPAPRNCASSPSMQQPTASAATMGGVGGGKQLTQTRRPGSKGQREGASATVANSTGDGRAFGSSGDVVKGNDARASERRENLSNATSFERTELSGYMAKCARSRDASTDPQTQSKEVKTESSRGHHRHHTMQAKRRRSKSPMLPESADENVANDSSTSSSEEGSQNMERKGRIRNHHEKRIRDKHGYTIKKSRTHESRGPDRSSSSWDLKNKDGMQSGTPSNEKDGQNSREDGDVSARGGQNQKLTGISSDAMHAKLYNHALAACESLSASMWTTDVELKVTSHFGPRVNLSHAGVPDLGRSMLDATSAVNRAELKERYNTAISGHRVERVFSVHDRHYLEILGPFRNEQGQLVGASGVLVQLMDPSAFGNMHLSN